MSVGLKHHCSRAKRNSAGLSALRNNHASTRIQVGKFRPPRTPKTLSLYTGNKLGASAYLAPEQI